VSAYRVNGFGDDLLGDSDDGITPHNLGSAYDRLTNGDQTGWNLGFEMSIPVGQRFAHAQVRNFDLRIVKARAALAAQEVEISHELAAAFRDIDRLLLEAGHQIARERAAAARLAALEAQYEADPLRITLDDVLRARDALVQVRIASATSIIAYNQALADLHLRGGRLLEYDSVHLAEGPWDQAAQADSKEHARVRANALPSHFLKSEPDDFAR
jgi:outer membrane protein TolC